MDLTVLEELGLSAAEAKIYLALLETGASLAGPIIKKTGLHRGTTYQVLQRLMEKGLVSSIVKGKKQHFTAAGPERLVDVLHQTEDRLQGILPTLKGMAAAGKEKQDVTVYAGVKGIRTVLDRMLEELGDGGEYDDFGVSGLFRSVMGPYWDLWQKRKRKQHIKSRVIFNEELRNSQLIKDYRGQARFHPKAFASLTDTMVYKDTVILLIWTAKPPIAVVIENKDNATSYKHSFAMMWKAAKR